MNAIGEFSLFLSLAVAAYAPVAAWLGGRSQRGEWIRSAENALHALLGLLSISTAGLIYALVTHDFSLAYVVNYSNRTQSMAYTVSALYGGNSGSLLFLAWMLALFRALLALPKRPRAGGLLRALCG